MFAESKLLKDQLLKTDGVIFTIPIFQRSYVWKANKHVETLLDDIEYLLENKDNSLKPKHFIGSIVYIKKSHPGSPLISYYLIDGQQRITTMYLLFKALRDSLIELGDELDKDYIEFIRKEFLYTKNTAIRGGSNSKSSEILKLKMTDEDQKELKYLFENNGRGKEKSHINLNYKAIKKRIDKWLKSGYLPSDIDEALNSIEYVDVCLDERDDTQKIFASLNSTGLELSNSDLIRNLLLMGDIDTETLYKDYWIEIEKLLHRDEDDGKELDKFLRFFLISKKGVNVNIKNVYFDFSRLLNQYQTRKDILEELYTNAKIYNAFLFPQNSQYTNNVKRLLTNLLYIDSSIIRPVLLQIFLDHNNKIITDKVLEDVLEILVSFLVRRAFVNAKTNGLNKFFYSLYRNAFKYERNKKYYLESIKKVFSDQSTTEMAFITDREVENALLTYNMYKNRGLCRIVLTTIENSGKEKIQTDNIQIEHIMPQTITPEWEEMLGEFDLEEYQLYLNTIGNLTLTGHNPELSNKSFKIKRQILKENSKAVVLNEDIINKNKWNFETIQERSKRLSKLIIKEFPSLDYALNIELEESVYALENVTENILKSSIPIAYFYNQKKYVIKSAKELLMGIVQKFYQGNPSVFISLVGKAPGLVDGKVYPERVKNHKGYREILDTEIYVYVDMRVKEIIQRIINYKNQLDDKANIMIQLKEKK